MSTKHTAARAIADAAREAAAAETRRCAEVTALCTKMGQPEAMLDMITSGKSLSEVEAELTRRASSASWSKAIAKAPGGQS